MVFALFSRQFTAGGKMAKTQTEHQHKDVSTASVARIGIFQPTRRPIRKTWEVKTGWGSARITGRLGQQHNDFIECCRDVALSEGIDGAGRYCCIVDPNKLRTALSAGRSRIPWDQMKKLAHELRECSLADLHIKSQPEFGVVSAGVLDAVEYKGVKQLPASPGARLGGVVMMKRAVVKPGQLAGDECRREIWMVAFSKAWTKLIGADMPVSYRGRLRHIVALRHGASQAAARFMLTHESGASYQIDTVLQVIGVHKSVLRHHRRELHEDAEGMAAAGVIVAGDEITTL